MPTEQELMAALRRADAAGDTAAAQAIARRIQQSRGVQPSADQIAAGTQRQRDDRAYQQKVRDQIEQDRITNDPTRGMSGMERFRAGIGAGLDTFQLGLQQVGAAASDKVFGTDWSPTVQAKIDEQKQLNRPLNQTGAGFVGNVAGQATAMIGPGAIAKAVGAPAIMQSALMPTTRTGNVLQGMALGGLQPVASDEGPNARLTNIALGGAGAYVGSKVADGISSLARPNVPMIPPQKAAAVQSARDAGYVLPPTEIRPSLGNEIVEGISGKIKTAQAASTKNQQVTNALAKKALGIADDTPMTRDTLVAIRQQAGQAYDAIGSVGQMQADTTYKAMLKNIAGKYERAGAAFPKAVKSKVTELVQALDEDAFDAAGAVDMVRVLRDQADTAFRQGETGLGKAAKDASKALEDLIERNLQKTGQGDLLKAFKDARQTIAKTYTVERALNDQTGDVSAKALAALLKKGKPLTGDLATIAQAGEAFPKATQTLPQSYNATSPLDWLAGLGGTQVTGNPTMLATIAARPALRSMALSRPYQQMITAKALTGRAMTPRLPLPYAATNRVLRRTLPYAGAAGLLGAD